MMPDEITKALNAVTVDDIVRVARDVLAPSNLRIGVIGPYEDKERFEKLLG